MTAGINTEHLAIQLVRQPRQGKPISCRQRRRCPLHVLPLQSGIHGWIAGHVNVIVIIDKGVAEHWEINAEGCGGEQKTNPNVLSPVEENCRVEIRRLTLRTNCGLMFCLYQPGISAGLRVPTLMFDSHPTLLSPQERFT